jgi:hypothetical protein
MAVKEAAGETVRAIRLSKLRECVHIGEVRPLALAVVTVSQICG